MLYPFVIHKDKSNDYGVTVPDLPGSIVSTFISKRSPSIL
jgi:predicted RNase H-like HicB family nuclease